MEIFQIFDQNYGLTRLEKFEFFDFSLSLIIVYKVLFSTFLLVYFLAHFAKRQSY